MKPGKIFTILNGLTALGWIMLVWMLFINPDSSLQHNLFYAVAGIILLLCMSYIYVLLNGRSAFKDGGFGSLEKVMTLFRHERATLAGWIHFLAFDLAIGALIVSISQLFDINTYLTIPILILTFLFGPSGLLAFAICILITQHHLSF